MSNKTLKLVFTIFISVFLISSVNAKSNEVFMIEKMANASAPKISSVSVNGSVATIKATGSISGYYIGTKNSINDSSTYSVSTSSNTYYVGVKNGTYYFWVYGGSAVSGSAGAIKYANTVNVTSSCNNQNVSGATGSGTVERCMVSKNGGAVSADASGQFVTCASGYSLDQSATKVVKNGCNGASTKYNGQQLARTYCGITYSYSCVKNNTDSGSSSGGNSSSGGSSSSSNSGSSNRVAAASLASLSVNQGSLSPAFSSGTKSYKVSVGSNVSSITINATAANGSSFVSGSGPRTVNLNYGSNKISVKVKNSAGSVTTYNIVVTRADARSNVNTLSSLTVSSGSLSPEFSSNNTTYRVDVPTDVTSIDIGGTLTDGAASFVDGFGPRRVNLNPGVNSELIKVRSQAGQVKVYTITIIRKAEDSSCSLEMEKYALLKSIELSSDLEDVKINQLDFDPNTFTYNIKVPYKVGNLTVLAYVQDDGDKHTIVGGSNLEVNIEQDVQITVQSRFCSSISKVYHIGVTREPEKELSDNAEIKSMTITNHSEFEFEQNTSEYRLKLNKGESELDIKYETENENAVCTIEGNENLGYGSEILVKCVSEDEENVVEYLITIDGVKKGTSVFLIILVIILVILVLGYLILRLLGYKIYFNFAVIGAFFRGIGEKIKNIFDR